MGITLTQSTGHSIDRFASRQVSKSAKGVRDAALRVRRSEKPGERGKGLAGGEAFFLFFHLSSEYQTGGSKPVKFVGVFWRGSGFFFKGRYFGAEASLLTIFEEKAKGRKSNG